jgi:hypothetical protein
MRNTSIMAVSTRNPRRRLTVGKTCTFQGTPTHVLNIGAAGTGVFPAAAPSTLVKGRGPVLSHPTIMPIFWGAEWVSPSPPIAPATLLDGMKAIIYGPYLDGLIQYGLTGKPTLLGPRYVSSSEPTTVSSVAGWQSEGISLLTRMIEDDQIAEPDEDWSRFSVIFLPSTVVYPPGTTGRPIFGFHSSFQWVDYDFLDLDDDPVRFAVIGTAPFGSAANPVISGLDMATYSFSHELVEAMTDPDGANGWRQSPGTGSATVDEIADSPCNQIGRLNGVAVASYWSNADNACIIPSLSRTAYFELTDTHVDSETNGPDVSFYVDRECGRDHHWAGEYSFHIVQRHLTLTFTGKPKNWVDPTGDWTVAGASVPIGPPKRVSVNLPVSFPNHPSATATTRLVTITATATNTTLKLVNDPVDGVYSVPVVYSVTETFNDGAPQSHKETWNLDVDIQGQALIFSQDYVDALAQCWREQLAAIGHGMNGVREIYDQFAELLRNHRGPPIDEHVVSPIVQAAGQRYRDLRDLATHLRRATGLTRVRG